VSVPSSFSLPGPVAVHTAFEVEVFTEPETLNSIVCPGRTSMTFSVSGAAETIMHPLRPNAIASRIPETTTLVIFIITLLNPDFIQTGPHSSRECVSHIS
jgi:hypothetical protein